MAWRTLVVALVVGCARPPAIVPPPPRRVPAFTSAPITLAPRQPHVGHLVCSPDPTPASWPVPPAKVKVYDFSPIAIALAFGPTEDAASDGFRRYGDTIRVAIINHTERLAACMRAAIGTKPAMRRDVQINRGELVTVKLALTIDPFGHARDIAVDGPPQLAPCITETIAAIRVNRRTPRETRASLELSFTNLQGVKHAPPPPPPVAETRPGCLVARDPLPVDTLELANLDIDFDPPAEHASHRVRCSRADVDKAEVREMIRANLGGLRGCYLAAAKQAPALGGVLTTQFTLGPWGQPTQITIGGVGDPALHDCVKTQLERMATQRMPDGAVQINLPFTLDPAPREIWTSPDQAFEAGDVDEAARLFAQAANAAHDADEACHARLGIVKAYANLPTGPDARTDAAVAELAAFTKAHPELASCRDDASVDLVTIARWPVRRTSDDLVLWRGAGLDEAVARSTKIVALFPHLRRELLPFMGRALTAMHQDGAFGPYLEYFTLGDADMKRVIWAADGYAESQREREDGVGWDSCEARAKL